MPRRTSPVEVLARFWVVAFLLALCPYGLLAVLSGAISLGFLALIALWLRGVRSRRPVSHLRL